MEHFRLRKYRSPETWRKVQEAYVAGEPAPSVARRFDVGLANIRKKASREGWTRNRVAASVDTEAVVSTTDAASLDPPPVDPGTARRSAIERAGALLAAGRAAEATALLKAAEAFGRMTEGDIDPPDRPAPLSPEQDAAREAAGKAAWDEMNAEIERRAEVLARALLTDTGSSSSNHAYFALRWRAEILGPEVAAQDRRHAEAGGWARRYWDEEGRLRPREEISHGLWETMKGTARQALGLPGARPGG